MELIEGMEELLLHLLLAGEELDIVDDEHVGIAVLVVEEGGVPLADGLDELVAEGFAGDVDDVLIGAAAVDLEADRRHQMGLAQAGRAVDEERVIGLRALVGGHGLACRIGELIGAADDEGIEGVVILRELIAALELGMLLIELAGVRHMAAAGRLGLDDAGVDVDDQACREAHDLLERLLELILVGGIDDALLELRLNIEDSVLSVELDGDERVDPCS